jgi:pilus assembly protein TadC
VTGALTALVGCALGVAVLVWPTRGARRRLERLMSAAEARAGAHPEPPDAPTSALSTAFVMELVAAALDAGLPVPHAVEAAVRAGGPMAQQQLGQVVELWRLGASLERVWAPVDARWQPLARALLLAERTGASAATILRASAGDLRAARRRGARLSAQRLGVGLVVPLGLTTLPAFLLWAVVPVVLGLAQQLLAGGSR